MLEDRQEMPPHPDVITVGGALLHFLRLLPEPILTYERYQAYLTCVTALTRGSEAQKKTIREVTSSLPLDCKASVRRVVATLHKAWKLHGGDPSNVLGSIASDTNIKPLIKSFLRSYVPAPAVGPDPKEAQVLVEMLVVHYDELFGDALKEEERVTTHVRRKLHRLSAISQKAKASVDDPENKLRAGELLLELYDFLERVVIRRQRIYYVSPEEQLTKMIDDHGHVKEPYLDRTVNGMDSSVIYRQTTNIDDAGSFIDSLRWEVRKRIDRSGWFWSFLKATLMIANLPPANYVSLPRHAASFVVILCVN